MLQFFWSLNICIKLISIINDDEYWYNPKIEVFNYGSHSATLSSFFTPLADETHFLNPVVGDPAVRARAILPAQKKVVPTEYQQIEISRNRIPPIWVSERLGRSTFIDPSRLLKIGSRWPLAAKQSVIGLPQAFLHPRFQGPLSHPGRD